MRVLDMVIDFLASVRGTVLQNFMALTGDSPQTPETAPTWVNVETFSAVGELLDRHAGQFSHALLKVNSQCSAPMAAISCFSLPFTAALKKKKGRTSCSSPECWREISTRFQTPTTQWRSASLGRDIHHSPGNDKSSRSSRQCRARVTSRRSCWTLEIIDEQFFSTNKSPKFQQGKASMFMRTHKLHRFRDRSSRSAAQLQNAITSDHHSRGRHAGSTRFSRSCNAHAFTRTRFLFSGLF